MTVDNDDLISAALEARKNAYDRYSNFSVGAALVDDLGRLHVGCNVENAAYPLGSCAEAGAIASMIQQGGKRIVRIAVVGGSGEVGPCTPCGGCRQRISEFADDDSRIIWLDEDGNVMEHTLDDLLPLQMSL